MFKEFLEFDIQIAATNGASYYVVTHGPGGDAREPLRLPMDDPVYQALALRLERLDLDERAMADLGILLFQAIFQGSIKETYIRSLAFLKAEQGLRLRFTIGPEAVQIAQLPWEFLYDPEEQRPLALLDTPIVRYLPQPASIPTLSTTLPLKVLLTSAQTLPTPDASLELNEIRAALQGLGDAVQIDSEEHLTLQQLQRLVRRGFHIWHFVGQASLGEQGLAGVLHLENGQGGVEFVSAAQLGILLNRSGIRLVVLNTCEKTRLAIDPLRSIASSLIRAQVPAVIAMQFSISERAARAFAVEFYKALSEGFPLDACATEGRKAVMNAVGLAHADWGIPVVYTRAPNGKLFSLTTPALVPLPRTDTVREGLSALERLMQVRDVYAAVVSCRDRFESVHGQIAALDQQKRMHDLFQQLGDSYSLIYHSSRRLPGDQRAWIDLTRSEPGLYSKAGEVLALATSNGASNGETLWTKKLGRARQELRMAIEQADLQLLQMASNQIDGVLGSIPWQVNTHLIQVAGALPLANLAQDLEPIWQQLSGLALDETLVHLVGAFGQGITALSLLDQQLRVLVQTHNAYQEIDNELRRIETEIEQDFRELASAWLDLRPMFQALCADSRDDRATRLKTICDELEQALEAKQPPRILMIFWRLRSETSQHFNSVDQQLLNLCAELKRVDEGLALVLKAII
jgi:hypothetical protein